MSIKLTFCDHHNNTLVLCLDDTIGNFEVSWYFFDMTHIGKLFFITCMAQVGKEFDALLVDVQAPNSRRPVFDVFEKDTIDVC